MPVDEKLTDEVKNNPIMDRANGLADAWVRSFFRGIDLSAILNKGDKVLEVGCGEGITVRNMHVDYGIIPHGVDLDDYRLSAIIENDPLRFKVGNAEDLPYKNGEFHFAFAFMVNRYVGEKWRSVQEMHRVLRKGGIGVFDFAITDNGLWNRVPVEPDLDTTLQALPHYGQLSLDRVPIAGPGNGRTSHRLTIHKKYDEPLMTPSFLVVEPFDYKTMSANSIYIMTGL